MNVQRIISGGQTGADRGGLTAAINLGIPHGGWCPKGRRAEDGKVPARYQLQETGSSSYQARTKRNVLEADGTVIFTRGKLAGGSLLTARVAREAAKPCLHLDLKHLGANPHAAVTHFRTWLTANAVRTLNVAGSRESKAHGMQAAVAKFLQLALDPKVGRREYDLEREQLVVDQPHLAVAEEAPPYSPPLSPWRKGSQQR
jgi:hypothetical protein